MIDKETFMHSLTTSPGANLVAQFEDSHEHFPAYHRAAMGLAPDARHDVAAADTLVRMVDHYAAHLHLHHTAEEIELFPAVVRARPDLHDSVRELLGQHSSLATSLERVRSANRTVEHCDDASRADAVDRLVEQLQALHDLVEHHLDFEEQTISPVVATWTTWPF